MLRIIEPSDGSSTKQQRYMLHQLVFTIITQREDMEDMPVPPQCYAKELNGAQEDAEISIRMFTVVFYAMKK